MNGRKDYRQLKILSLPVIVLYSLFFTVQVFFNFDNPTVPISSCDRQAVLGEPNSQHAQTLFGHGKHQNPSAPKIRLNKRFQPASSPALIPFYVKAPVVFIEKEIRTVYQTPFHTSPSLFTNPLRGPPVVVYPIV